MLGGLLAVALPTCPCNLTFHQTTAFASVSESHAAPAQAHRFSEFGAEKIGDDMGKKLRWEDLQQLNYESGVVPPALKELDGKLVSVAGFAVPLGDDGSEKLSEFVLVPQPMMCIHVPPPPPNQIVLVKMKSPVVIESLYLPIWMTGTLKIVKPKSEYGDASFEMVGLRVTPYEEVKK